jgi:hypothetical protein
MPTRSSTVQTSHGLLRGVLETTTISWRGVPFAAPPVGRLRWRTPQQCGPWTGVRAAEEFGPRAPQVLPANLLPRHRANETDGVPQSEDCLYLNVCAPSDARGPCPSWSGSTAAATTQAPAPCSPVTGPPWPRPASSPDYRLGALGLLRSDHRLCPTSSATHVRRNEPCGRTRNGTRDRGGLSPTRAPSQPLPPSPHRRKPCHEPISQ